VGGFGAGLLALPGFGPLALTLRDGFGTGCRWCLVGFWQGEAVLFGQV